MSSTNLTLIQGGTVYSPIFIGNKDILIGGGKILDILDPTQSKMMEKFPNITIIDNNNKILTPGFIDGHVHVTGGGGEAGPASRTPEAQISEIINAGLTTVIGILGTDAISRSLENLLSKIRALEIEGISTWMYTGAYRVPPPTLTKSISHDLIIVDKVIGVGEIAISDHRSSHPTLAELSKLASESRVGGMLAGKAGIVHCHLGSGEAKLDLLWEVINKTPLPITQFLLTHMTRTNDLFSEGKKWLNAGGWIDLTAELESGETVKALEDLKINNNLLNHVTISSDAYGSFPVFDETGTLIKMDVGKPDSLIKLFKSLYNDFQWKLEQILPLFTTNPASILQLPRKGIIKQGYDADLLIFNQDLDLESVIAKGQILKSQDYIKKGKFED